MEPQTAARYRLLDELRGLDLISMMLYHGMWDVVFLFGVAQKWYTGRPGFVWQQSICWVFILLSGFCLPLGHHPFRRGAVVFGAGALVTAVTLLFLPEDVVWFGVLTLLGSSMLLTAALDPLFRRVPPAAGVALSALLFWGTYPTMNGFWNLPGGRLALPQALYASWPTAYWDLCPRAFSPPTISRCCPGCFCSGWGTSSTTSWAADASRRCAGRSARRWAGWAVTRWCSICSISRSSWGC